MERKKNISVTLFSIIIFVTMLIIPFLLIISVIILDNSNINKYALLIKNYYRIHFDPKYKDELLSAKTKDKLLKLKRALLAYQGDIGRLPYVGNSEQKQKKSAYNQELILNTNNPNKNVLTSDNEMNFEINNYKKRWKGPYMEGKLSDFMFDSWNTPIKYIAENKTLYLWSYGPNKKPDFTNVDEAIKSKNTDDIVIIVSRFRRKFED